MFWVMVFLFGFSGLYGQGPIPNPPLVALQAELQDPEVPEARRELGGTAGPPALSAELQGRWPASGRTIPAEAGTPASYSLMDCYKLALERSETLQIEAEKIKQMEARMGQAMGGALPRVSLNLSDSFQDTPNSDNGGGIASSFLRRERPEGKFSLEQTLFSGLKEPAAIRGARLLRERESLLFQRASKNLFLEVARAFYDVIRLTKDFENMRFTIDLAQEHLKELRSRVDLGKSRLSEVLATQSQLALFEAEEKRVDGELSIAQETLAYHTALGANAILDDDLKDIPALDLESVFAAKARQRSDILALQYSVSAAQANERVVRANLLPSANFLGNYYFKRVGFQQGIDWDALVTLEVPLFQGGAARARWQESKSQTREAEWNLKKSQRLLDLEVKTDYHRLKASLAQTKALEEALAKAQESYHLQVKEYRLGLVNNLEVLQAMNNLLLVQRDLDTVKMQTKVRYLELQVAAEVLP